ncbi:hypothetical protein [Microbacterium sp. NPDC058389]|uniref:hypothetical protein n=1 Tax=Microbacterium sp. NPDC058389 TaxID=3346475 RepID=UPI00365E1462
MTHRPDPEPTPQPAVEVDVARSGGIAGITRRWSAQPSEDEASDWISLIDRCPWDETGDADPEPTAAAAGRETAPRPEAPTTQGRPPVPDGFTWWIRAVWSDADPREAELVDDQVVGAWRDLVDAVRDWSRRSGDGH